MITDANIMPEHEDKAPPSQDSFYRFLGMPIVIWIALIGLATTTVSGIVGHNVGLNQANNNNTQLPVLQPESKSPSFSDTYTILNQVRGQFLEPHATIVGRKIECAGTIKNLAPNLHLWVAVEVDGYLWFKDSEIDVNTSRTRWSKTITEGGTPSEFSLLLFVADDEANEEINAWLVRGIRKNNNFDKIAFIRGAARLDHLDNLKIKD
jgi:hypothetical protein